MAGTPRARGLSAPADMSPSLVQYTGRGLHSNTTHSDLRSNKCVQGVGEFGGPQEMERHGSYCRGQLGALAHSGTAGKLGHQSRPGRGGWPVLLILPPVTDMRGHAGLQRSATLSHSHLLLAQLAGPDWSSHYLPPYRRAAARDLPWCVAQGGGSTLTPGRGKGNEGGERSPGAGG